MFAKDNNINITIQCLARMENSVLFLHTSESMTGNPSRKIDKVLYFYQPSLFESDIIFKESLFNWTY